MPRTSDMQETRRELEWSDLATILAIGRAGSLSGAARSLGKTHSTVYRNIKAIEEKTGVLIMLRGPFARPRRRDGRRLQPDA